MKNLDMTIEDARAMARFLVVVSVFLFIIDLMANVAVVSFILMPTVWAAGVMFGWIMCELKFTTDDDESAND